MLLTLSNNTMKIFKDSEPDRIALCDELNILNNRLTASSYLEDRISAINSLKEIAEKNPNEVGIYSMASVIESMQYFVHRNHFEVLSSIFRSSNGQEFQEIFLKIEKYVQILINARNKRGTDILVLLATKDHSKVGKAFTNDEKQFTYFKRIDERAFKLIDILIRDVLFKKKLVENGIFERIFELLHEQNLIKSCFGIIANLLHNSFECQDYFYNTEWKKIFEPYRNRYPHYYFNVLEKLLDTRNINFAKMQEDFKEVELATKALELKRYDFVFIFFYNRVGLDAFMKDFDYYSFFLKTERKRELLKIYFLVTKPFNLEAIDLNNEYTCYFLTCYFFKKFYEEVHTEKIVSELSNVNLTIKDSEMTHKKRKEEEELERTGNEMDNKNDTTHLFGDEGADEEVATEEFYTKINLTNSTAVPQDFLSPYYSFIDLCQQELQRFTERSTYFVTGLFIFLNIMKTKLILTESHIASMLAFVKDDTQNAVVKGLIILLVDTHALTGNNEENLMFYVRELRKYFCCGQNILHENVNDLFVLLITERIKVLQEMIGSREPVSFSSEQKPNKEESKKINTSNEEDDHHYKKSPKDVFRTIMSNVSSKFTTSDEDDSFNL